MTDHPSNAILYPKFLIPSKNSQARATPTSLNYVADDITQRFLRYDSIQVTTFIRNQFVDNNTSYRSFFDHLLDDIAVLVQIVRNHTYDEREYLLFLHYKQSRLLPVRRKSNLHLLLPLRNLVI